MSRKRKQKPKRNKKYTPKTVASTPAVGPRKPLVNQPLTQPIRILIWGATPYVITGFGNVMKQLLRRLYHNYPGQYDICQMGINYYGDHVDELEITGSFNNGRFRQWPAAVQRSGLPMAYMFGQNRFVDLVKTLKFDFDMIFLAEDPFWLGGRIPTDPPGQQRIFIDEIRKALAIRKKPHIPIIGYFPIDGTPDKEWVDNLLKYDVPITYLPFGARFVAEKNKEMEGRVNVLPLGLDKAEFYPLPKEEVMAFKRAYFGEENVDKYVVLNCNRNQIRKFLPANLMAFKAFKDKYPDSIMYLHMRDAEQVGWNLPRAAKNIGLEIGKDIFFPANFNINQGISVQDLNKIFNIADMLTTTALGGGWELALTQAFATKTLVVAPANTSHVELCAGGRGLLYKCGDRLSHLAILRGDNEVIRPLPNTDDMVQKMIWARENPEKVEEIKENAYKWTHDTILWEQLVPKWHDIFLKSRALKVQREAHVQQQQQQQAQQLLGAPPQGQGVAASVSFDEEEEEPCPS